MGPPEDCTCPSNRPRCTGGRKARRPRTRQCLLKGCQQRFRPRQAQQRYCGPECRKAARRWLRWKAQQRYRATEAGKEKRNGQSRRYRERARNRQPAKPAEPLAEAARVITPDFFRPRLRSPWLLRRLCRAASLSRPAVLLQCMPARHGAGLAARAAMAEGPSAAVEPVSRWPARDKPDVLIPPGARA